MFSLYHSVKNVSTQIIVFGCFTDYSLWTVVIRLHIHVYFSDWFCRGGGSFRQRKLRGAFVFEIKKTKAPKLELKTDFPFLSANPNPDFWLVERFSGISSWTIHLEFPSCCHLPYSPWKMQKNNEILFKLFWHKVFVHWKLKLLNVNVSGWIPS